MVWDYNKHVLFGNFLQPFDVEEYLLIVIEDKF